MSGMADRHAGVSADRFAWITHFLLLQGVRGFGASGPGQRFESAFVSEAAPLRKIGGVEALPPEKSADLPRTVGESVGLTYDGQFIGRCEPPTTRPLGELRVGCLRHRSSVGPRASLAYGSLRSGAAIASSAIPLKQRHLLCSDLALQVH